MPPPPLDSEYLEWLYRSLPPDGATTVTIGAVLPDEVTFSETCFEYSDEPLGYEIVCVMTGVD